MYYHITYRDYQAVVCPRLGANIIAFTKAGKDILVPLTDEQQLTVNPYLQGAPLLLPANRTANGCFCWQGKEYRLPVNEALSGGNLHGFLHQQVFTLEKISDNRICMSFVHTPDENFPFALRMEVTYLLDDHGLTQTYAITNIQDTAFPFTFSTHTTFVEPDAFSVPIDAEQERNGQLLPTGRYTPLSSEQLTYVNGSVSKGKAIVGYYRACGHTAHIGPYTYTVSDNFDHFILYNGNGTSGFLCVEPQSGAVNGLNIPHMHRVIQPSETITFRCNIQ